MRADLKLVTQKTDTSVNKHKSKGDLTKSLILDAALHLAGRDGLEGLTIGLLADRMNMSKSGVFAHFESRESLQIEVIQEYNRRFKQFVFDPSMKLPRGLPRLEMMLDLWISLSISELTTGCIYISGAIELDDRPGPVRDELVQIVQNWRSALMRAIQQSIEEGHLRNNCDPRLMLFAIYSAILGLQHDARFLQVEDSIDVAKICLKKIIDDRKPK
jgi:AcrR family transcriptional regulator